MPHVTEARVIDGYRVFLRFNDGVQGILDFSEFLPSKGVFAPLSDPAAFAQIYVDPEMRTVAWPTGADLDALVLHSRVTGEPIVVDGEVMFDPATNWFADGRSQPRQPDRVR